MAISAPLTGTRPVDPNAVKNTLGVYKTPLIEVSTKCAFTNTTQGFPLDGFCEWKKDRHRQAALRDRTGRPPAHGQGRIMGDLQCNDGITAACAQTSAEKASRP